MQHVAIDLGGKESWICVRSETGKILEEVPYRTVLLEWDVGAYGMAFPFTTA